MFGTQLNYIEDEYGLSISYKWYTPLAIFLVFFSIAWNSFLFFWYSTALGSGAPWIMIIFPLVHVAAGLAITYYTLCLLFNKTNIDVANGFLDIHHSPIPWWKGNVHIPTSEIEQIYVKEKTTRNKSNVSLTYELHIKLADGNDKSILTTGHLDSQQAKELEHRLEAHIGINNVAVHGEYHLSSAPAPAPQARRHRRMEHKGPLSFLYQTTIGDAFQFEEKEVEVQHISQYDWNDGNSDKSIQLLDDQQQERLWYLHKNMGLIHTFSEYKIPLFESSEIVFLKVAAPDQIRFQDQVYFLDAHYKGQAFQSNSDNPLEVEQWIYTTKNKAEHVRIVNNQNQMSYFRGEKMMAENIKAVPNKGLELRDLDPQYPRDEEDEGFV